VQVPEPPRTVPPPDLLPAGPAGRTPTAGQVRETLARTKQKLDSIDRRRLNAGKRAISTRPAPRRRGAVNDNLLAESSVKGGDAGQRAKNHHRSTISSR
jgi:hypothetical protein